MEFNFNSYDNSKQSISYCEVDKCPTIVSMMDKNKKLKQALKNISKGKIGNCCCAEEYASKALEG